ncbi:MAG: M1 family aminopeptidase [Chloroflexota bacterium]|nr:M1 family aminopeptidase [Chloroflexota bacterium]
MLTIFRFSRGLLVGVLLASCNLAPPDALSQPTSTGVRITQASLIAPTMRNLQDAPTRPLDPTPIFTDTISATCTDDAAMQVQHSAEIALDYADKRADVRQTIRLINPFDGAIDTIAFNVEPNRLPGAFVLRGAVASVEIEAVEVVGRRLTVDLVEPLEPGCPVEMTFSYALTLPPIGGGVSGLSGYFGYSNRQVNLGHALITLAHRRDDQWAAYDVTVIGEQITAAAADWEVTLTVSGAPDSLILAAPGAVTTLDDTSWQIQVESSRDLALSLSPFFRQLQAFTTTGVAVEVYSFDNAIVETPVGRVDGAEQALAAAMQSLTLYADLYADYSTDRFVVVQGDFPDGMEFSGLVFVGDQWFRTNPGTAESYLTIITVHEVAHQWWYARVGSDQALSPWLDEALATYSEYVFYEQFYPDLTDWWWNFRVRMFVPAGYSGRRVDSTVYEFATVRDYINAVYLRGAEMLHQMRSILGNDAFFAWLRRYSEAEAGKVVVPDGFWSYLTADEQNAIQLIRESFMRGEG